MTNAELVKFFILAMKNKYPNFYNPFRYELATPTQFRDDEMQLRWLGFQLCYENLGDIALHEGASPKQPERSPLPSNHNYRTVYDGELHIHLHNNQVSLFYIPKDEQDNRWIYALDVITLVRANTLIKNLLHLGRIDLNEWHPFSGNLNQIYLVGLTEGRKSHIWNGNDTYCKAWFQNGLKKNNYKLSDITPTSQADTCQTCIGKLPRGMRLPIPKSA